MVGYPRISSTTGKLTTHSLFLYIILLVSLTYDAIFRLNIAGHFYYDGCISGLTISSSKRNILVNDEAKVGTVSGCKLVKKSFTVLYLLCGQTEPEEGYTQITKLPPKNLECYCGTKMVELEGIPT